MATGEGMGANPPTFCQDGARAFFKTDEKMSGRGVVANLQRNGGRGQKNFIYAPSTFIALGANTFRETP